MDFLWDGPEDSAVRLALAHGASGPMDSPFMQRVAEGLGSRGARVARFEFPYMASSRRDGKHRPPDRTPLLLETWKEVARALGPGWALGGKSLGGRMASMLADELKAPALVCLGYPFHPPGAPGKLRVEHLAALRTPALVVQGTRDPFGPPADVAGYTLSQALEIYWVPEGDHSFKPPARSGRTEEQNLGEALDRVWEFLSERLS